MSDLNKVFNPGSVAVIGASETSGKASERRSRSLIEGGYRGEIYLINPNRPQLFSRKAYPTITEVGKEVDLVMVVVSPKLVASAVADSVKMGAKGVVGPALMSSGLTAAVFSVPLLTLTSSAFLRLKRVDFQC